MSDYLFSQPGTGKFSPQVIIVFLPNKQRKSYNVVMYNIDHVHNLVVVVLVFASMVTVVRDIF